MASAVSHHEPRRAAGLLALRTIAEAHGGLGAVNRNPTLKTILAVLGAVGMRLSVEAGGLPDDDDLQGVAGADLVVGRGARSTREASRAVE